MNKRTTIYLDEETLKHLKIYCVKNNTSLSELIRDLLATLNKKKKEAV